MRQSVDIVAVLSLQISPPPFLDLFLPTRPFFIWPSNRCQKYNLDVVHVAEASRLNAAKCHVLHTKMNVTFRTDLSILGKCLIFFEQPENCELESVAPI